MENIDLLENYFENAIIPQLYIDSNLILRKFTPPAMKQFTLSYNDIGKNINELINNIRYQSIVDNINEVLTTQTAIEKEIQTTDSRWFQMNMIPFLIRKENRTDGVILTFVDITKRIKALTDLQKLHTNTATFTYSVSHDIRQPLTSMNLGFTVMKEAYYNKNDTLFELSLEVLQRNLSNIAKIVETLASQSTQSLDVLGNEERINIEDIWEDVSLALKDEIYKCQATISTNFHVSEIMFSRINLRSIVYNLLYNAIKYRKPNEKPVVRVSTEKLSDSILLTITDNGIGIDPSHHAIIFKESTRVNSNGDGKGIGLFLVSSMLQNNNGKIEVESVLGEGATFKVYFPVN